MGTDMGITYILNTMPVLFWLLSLFQFTGPNIFRYGYSFWVTANSPGLGTSLRSCIDHGYWFGFFLPFKSSYGDMVRYFEYTYKYPGYMVHGMGISLLTWVYGTGTGTGTGTGI